MSINENKILRLEKQIEELNKELELCKNNSRTDNIKEMNDIPSYIYKYLFEQVHTGIFFYDNDLIVYRCNNFLAHILHASVEKLVGFNLNNLKDKSFHNALKSALSGNPAEYLGHYTATIGTAKIWAHLRTAPLIDNNEIVGGIGVLSDLTQQKENERALAHSENMFRNLIENAFDAIYLLNQRHYEYVNPRFCEITGYSYEELTDNNFDINIILTEKTKVFINERYQARLMGEDIPGQYEVEIISKDGEIKVVEVSTVSIGTADEVKVLGIMRDITERHKSLIAIKEREQNLILLNAQKDKFFSIISHDLRSPIAAFMGLTEIMLDFIVQGATKDTHELATELNRSAQSLYRLLENLLEWSKIQRGLVRFTPEIHSLFGLATKSVEPLLPSINLKSIDFELDIAEDLQVYADASMLNTVIRNLLSNAIKYTQRNGKIELNAKYISIEYVQLSISDNGVGISGKDLANLFKFDIQNTKPGTENESSGGLGLILCKDFIEINGGQLSVESSLGMGSTFSIILKSNE